VGGGWLLAFFTFASGLIPYVGGVNSPVNPSANSPHALVAHALRRLTFGPNPELVNRFATEGPAAAASAIEWALAAPERQILPAQLGKEDWDPNLRGWVDNLRSPDSGVHEKLVWFWHSHFATSAAKVSNQVLVHGQQRLFREHGYGNYRTLLRAVLTDPAMLLYLDASYSNVAAPNENLSREMLELFTLGRGNYTEADVKAGALALAGYEADYETGAVKFNAESALGGEVTYLGRRGRLGVDDLVDILCAHSALAPHIAGKLYRYFVGGEPSAERLAELAQVFVSNQLEIRPLVEAIARSEDFISVRMNRPRFALEWFTGALAAIGPFRPEEDQDVGPWVLEQLDQLPYQPPNVAGWSLGQRWLSPSQQLTRAAYVWGISWKMQPIDQSATDMVAATLERCSLFDVSQSTRNTLAEAATATAGAADALSVSRRLITVALCSPEFALA
jgi:uncharacterized protein (DUF1800 family)